MPASARRLTGKLRIALFLVLGPMLAGGCEFYVGSPAPTPTLVEPPPSFAQRPMVTVARGRIEEAIHMNGRVVAEIRENLFFKVGGRVATVHVRRGQEVAAGELLVTLEIGDLLPRIDQAWNDLGLARQRVAVAETVLAAALAGAQADVLLGDNDVARLMAELNDLLAGPTDEELAVADAEVAIRAAELSGARAAATALAERPEDDPERVVAVAQVELSLTRLSTAEAARTRLEDGPDEAAVKAARNALQAATVTRDNASRKLDALDSGAAPETLDLAILETAAETASSHREKLEAEVVEHDLRATIDGEVTFVDIERGDRVEAFQDVVGVADPETLVLEATIRAEDQPLLEVDQPVVATLSAFPGVEFSARVASIPHAVTDPSGQTIRVPYGIVVADWDRPGVEMGMRADLKVTLRVKEDVLKVPISAVRNISGRNFVETVIDGQRLALLVTTGIRSETEIEIENGLEAGTTIFAAY